MAEILIPGGGIFSEPTTSGEYLVPGIGIVSTTISGGIPTEITGTVGALVIAEIHAVVISSALIVGTVGAIAVTGVDAFIGTAEPIVGTVGTIDITGITAIIENLGIVTTSVIKNNTGTVISNDTGITVDVYSVTTGVLAERFTGQTSDANGILTVTSNNITPGLNYIIVVRRSTDAIGVEEVTAT